MQKDSALLNSRKKSKAVSNFISYSSAQSKAEALKHAELSGANLSGYDLSHINIQFNPAWPAQLMAIDQRAVVQRGQGSSKGAGSKPEVTKESVMNKDVALYVVNEAFGRLMKFTLEANVIFYDDRSAFEAAFKKYHEGKGPEDAVGFTVTAVEKSGREIHILRKEASFDAMVHELIHHNSSPAWNKEFRSSKVVHEGSTQLLTTFALRKSGIKEPSGVYAAEMQKLIETNDGIDFNLIANAYFLGDESLMKKKVGSKNKSLIETAWFIDFGDWDVPEITTFDFLAVAQEGEKKKSGDSTSH